ncbi:MAG: putative rane protein [Caulobacter sp.]|nr:putative rane protein [Caulobacter sp.]
MTAASEPRPRADLLKRLPAAVFVFALVTAVPVWWLVATPILGGAPAPFLRHAGHAAWTYLHAATGTVMLFSGALALWIGWTRRQFRFHRWVGGAYLLTGTFAAGVALALTVTDVHRNLALASATGTLAAAWLLTATMAFRAIRNRRIEIHRDWVIRSYVLTWSFVFCRGLGYLPLKLNDETQNALLWMTWIIPLLLCEAALQWRAGGPRLRA